MNHRRTQHFGLKPALSLGLLALLPATAAVAQSNVTIYGVVDTGVERVTNIGTSHAAVVRVPGLTGTLPSRLGFRGSEDLGGGMKAVFVLESGFSTDQGTLNQGGRMFGRQAYVGLQTPYGQVAFGRQYSQQFWSNIGDVLGPNIYSAIILDPYLPNARLDNSLTYSHKIGDLSFGTGYSFGRDAVGPAPAGGCVGEVAGDFRACNDWSGFVQYATKGWGASTSFERMWGGPTPAGTALANSSVRDTRAMVAGYVMLGTVKLGATWLERRNGGTFSSTNPNKSRLWQVGATYPMGQFEFTGNIGQLNDKNTTNDATALGVRALYNLSRRTATYVTMGRVLNKGGATYTIDGGVTGGANPTAGNAQTGLMVGLRHIF